MSSDVKVGIKLRPLIEREKDANLSTQWIVKENSIASFDQKVNKCEENEFHFDHVFDINATNAHVFNSIIKPIADAALDGYHGTIFCYGPFDTGKTYTMTGTLQDPGIIAHTIEYIFNVISNTINREFLLRVSYIEICDEQINDLLNKNGINLKLCKDDNGQVTVNSKEEITNSTANMLSIMQKGIKNKRTPEINRNKCAASHSLFKIIIESQDVEKDSKNIVQVSHLNFVDLAGFEKFHCTDSVQKHQTNISLSTLESHIRFLNASKHLQEDSDSHHSKLTELLQSSLIGNAVIAIICTVTPIALEETYYTLLFASQMKNIKTKPQKNEVVSDTPLLIRYTKQLTKLRTELEKMENICVESEEGPIMLLQKCDINYLLEERIKLLKSQIISGYTRNCEESYKHKPRRKQTWCNPGIFKQCLPLHHSKADLPTIKEMSPEKPYKKNITQSIDIINQTLQTAFTDFELELIDCEAVNKSKDNNVVDHKQDEFNIALQNDNCFLTPEKQDSSVQTSSNHASPSTPKSVLRSYISDLTKDLSELREFTTLEKQIMCEENHLCIHASEGEPAQPSTCSSLKCDDVDKCSSNLIVQLQEEKVKLTEDLELKIQELDEIKNDIQSLKLDIEKLEETIYLLTNENMEISNKLATEKERSKETEINLQRIIDNLHAHILKITDEEINFEINIANVNSELQSSNLKASDDFDSAQVTTHYQNKIDALERKNIELSAIIAEKDNELKSIKESKSLLCEHECIYKDKLAMSKEKNNSLVAQNNKLTTDLMNTLEENNTLKEQCDILRNKMSSVIENTNSDESSIEHIRSENSILKAEIGELKMKITILSDENAKFSHNLLETMEDLDNSRNEKLNNDTLHLFTEQGSPVKGRDVNKKVLYKKNYEELANKVIMLQDEVNRLTHLNKKLSDLKITPCSQCAHLNNLNQSRRALKIETKILNYKLEDLQKKFDRKCADTEALKIKVNQDLNFSFSDTSLNASFVDGTNVSFVEEKVQHLNNELQVLRDDHDRLSILYKEKCNELVKLHGEVIDSKSAHNSAKLQKSTFKNETKIERIQKSIDQVKDEIDELKKNNANFASALGKFLAEKASLLDEINMLKSMNQELQQKMSEKEISEVTATKKTQILQSELLNMSEEIKQYSAKEKIMRTEKLTLEVKLEDMKAEKKDRDVLITGLHRTIDDLNECISSLKNELDLVTNQRNELTNSTETIERKYKDELVQLQKQCNELEKGKQESTEIETRATMRAKELETKVENLQTDLEKQESLYKELQKKVSELENLLQESTDAKTTLNEKLRALEVQLSDSKDSTLTNYKNEFETVAKNVEEYTKESEIKLNKINETLNKYVEENDTLTQELTKFRDIESKFKDLKDRDEHAYNEEKSLITDNNKLKEELDTVKECMIKELKALKYKVNSVDFCNKTADEIFIIFLQALMSKEEEVIKKLRELFEKDKQNLVDKIRQSADAEKRVSLWAKELETEIEKLQLDLTRKEELCKEQQDKVRELEHFLRESEHEKETLKEKVDALKFDYSNLQSEFEKECKVDIHQREQAVILAQKREKEMQKAFKDKEIEFLSKIKSEKEIYKREIEELTSTIQNYKTKNIELKTNIEGLEANEKQLKNVIDTNISELKMNNQTIHKMTLEIQQLTEAYDEINQVVEEKTSRIESIAALLKNKCDIISEYKNKLDTVLPDYELLKNQVKERKESLERYKEETRKLKMEKERQIEIIKDKLHSEEIKNVGLNKQLNELNIKNVALVEKLDNLKEKYEELQKINSKLEKKIRNSISKIKAGAEMDELIDVNKRLQNNLEGASNRVTEVLMDKNNILKELVSLRGQYELISQENLEIKKSLSLYESKYITPCLSQEDNKYDALLQEKNKIALELEGKKLLLNQKDKEINELTNQLKDLDIKKKEFDNQLKEYTTIIYNREVEISDLKNILHVQQCQNKVVSELEEKLKIIEQENKILKDHLEILKEKSEANEEQIDDASPRNEAIYYTLKRERSNLQIKLNGYENKLKLNKNNSNSGSVTPDFETNRRRDSRIKMFNERRQLENVTFDTDVNENNEVCQMMRKKIQELELQLVSQNGQIAALEVQIQSENFPYQKKCKELEDLLLTYRNRNTELNAEIRILQRTLNDINAWECDTCKRWRINRREQACQSSPTNTLERLKMDNGIIDDHAKIMKLEKEKAIIKGICRAQCRQVKNLEDKVRELEGTQTVSSLKRIQLLSEMSVPEYTDVMHSKEELDLEKSKKQAMKENVPNSILMLSKYSNYEGVCGVIVNCEYIPEVSLYC